MTTDIDAATETETEADSEQPLPSPEHIREALRIILENGNAAFCEEDGCILTGTPTKPGVTVPYTAREVLMTISMGLLGGEHGSFLVSRRGRHFVRYGSLTDFDDTTTDVDLEAWARGTTNYRDSELFEAIDAFYGRIVLTREEALAFLVERGVVTADQARQDLGPNAE